MRKTRASVWLLILLPVILFSRAASAGGKDKIISADSKNTAALPNYFYKRMEGTIGEKYKIVMNLFKVDSTVRGNYYYVSHGEPIKFNFESRIYDGGKVYLGEFADRNYSEFNSIPSGEFTGRFISGSQITGIWKKGKDRTHYNFTLTEKYPSGSAMLSIESKSERTGNQKSGAYINFIYPQLKNERSPAAKTIDKDIEETLLSSYGISDTVRSWKDFGQVMKSYINNFKEFKNDTSMPEIYKEMVWTYQALTYPVFNGSGILALESENFHFEGGAHPNSYFVLKNYDLKTGSVIKLDELLKGNYKAKLDELGEKEFRKQFSVKPGESLEKAGFFITGNQFHLNDNFAVTAGGLLFKFNPYEITAYAYGAPEIFIPYSEIKEYIKPDGPLSNLIK